MEQRIQHDTPRRAEPGQSGEHSPGVVPRFPIEVSMDKLTRQDLLFAAGVLGRAYRDNPLTIAMLGSDPGRRLRSVERILGSRLSVMEEAPLLAHQAGRIVGVSGAAPPTTA